MISQFVKDFLDNIVLPALLQQAGLAMPLFGIAINLPIIGPGLKTLITWFFNKLYDQGVITIKTNLIALLSDIDVKKYEKEVTLLREYQAQDSLTKEQEDEYAKRLQNAIKNRPGIVNS